MVIVNILRLWKYQSLSNQSFKHNSANMPSSNLTPKLSFVFFFFENAHEDILVATHHPAC